MIFDDLIEKDIIVRYKTDKEYLHIHCILLEVNNSGIWIKRKSNNKSTFFPYTSIEFVIIDNS